MSGNKDHLFFEKSIVQNQPPVWIIRTDNMTFYSVNEAAEKELLYEEKELFGESISKVCPSFSLNELFASAEINVVKSITTRVKRKDGREQIAKLEITDINYEGENYFHIIITPLVSSNAGAYKLSDFFYSHTMNSSMVPIIIIEKQSLKIVNINEGAIRLYGYSREEFLNMKFTSLLHANESENVTGIFSNLKENTANRFEIRQITRNNRTIEAEIFIQLVKSFEGDLLVICIHDISEKKLALRLLENNLNNFRLIANNSTDLIIRQAPEGKITYASPASQKLLGYAPGFLIINNIYNFMHPLDTERIKTGIANMSETSSYKTRFRVRNSSGKYVWLESTATMVYDSRSISNPEIISVSRDISEQVEIENKLIEANEKAREVEKLKHIILANISHEMRTPLQSILGYSQNIREKVNNPDLEQDINYIYENGQRLLRMINLFLNLSYLEANNFLPHFEIHNIEQIVHNAAEPFFNLAKQKNISLTATFTDQPLYVYTDKIILRDILDNLLDNAIKFTKTGYVKIIITSEKINGLDYIVVTIIDSGIGIPGNKEHLVVEEFRQISEGLSRNYEGVGLGISVVKRLVEKINGKIFINSTEGKGTTVKVFLTKEEAN